MNIIKLKKNLPFHKKLILKFFENVLKRINLLKDIHKDETCYIFGDGVSIKWFDLASFSDKPTFGLNKIIFHNQSKFLNLQYNLFLEPYYFYPYFLDRDDATVKITGKRIFRNEIQKQYRKVIKKNKTTFFINLSNYPVLWSSKIQYLFHEINDLDNKFIEECSLKNINYIGGSFQCAITLAIYMGFSKIFLVGCDYTHDIARSDHWYQKGQGRIGSFPNYQKDFLDIAIKYVDLMTITIEGKSKILPSKTYSEFTNNELKFRENYQLMDYSMLDIISRDPWYKGTIF